MTGAHRSGTTLLGDVVSSAPGSWTVWEPFNRHWGLRGVEVAYPYLREADADDPALVALRDYLRTGRARWSVKRGAGGRPLPRLRQARTAVRRYRIWRGHRGGTPVVKDPFLLLSLGAVRRVLTRRPVVVTVRHPGAWVASLRRMGWPAGPELNALVGQERLYEEHLRPLLPRRDWTRADEVEAGATAWACLYRMVQVQAEAGADVLVVPVEGWARDPVTVLLRLFTGLGLPVPPDPEALATRYSASGQAVTPPPGQKHLLRRDSRALVDAWKGVLTPAEAKRVRAVTEPVLGAFYRDWTTAQPAGPAATRLFSSRGDGGTPGSAGPAPR